MSPSSDPLTIFEEHRSLLFGIAYRMLGTVMDAQDMVQNTFLRWHKAEVEKIESPRAWLTTVLSRLCLNQLQSARVQRETYVGAWLPEPLVEELSAAATENARLADSLSLAFLVLLETLTPTERAVFILREVFAYEFAEIAPIVEKTEANCRQILARARKQVVRRESRFDTSADAADALMQRFNQAVRAGQLEELIDLLASDIVLVTDGGGNARALAHPVSGREHVARVLIGATRKFASRTEAIQRASINGLPGFVSFEGLEATRVVAFGLREGRICQLFVITNPEKLLHLARGY